MDGIVVGAHIIIKELGKVIDEAVVLSVLKVKRSHSELEVRIRSQKLHPGCEEEFALIGETWRMLFDDPMSFGHRCFSWNSPGYKFELAP